MLRLLAIFLFLLCFATAKGEIYKLTAYRIDTSNSVLPEGDFVQVTDLVARIRSWVPEMQAQGYLSASVDSIGISGNDYQVYCFTGQKYTWAKLSMDSIPVALLSAAGVSSGDFVNRPISPSALSRLSERLLNYCEQNGYPFAKVSLNNLRISTDHRLSATLQLDFGALRKIDTIIVNGSVRISNAFLQRYLDVFQGSLYNEQKLEKISARLRELNFLQEEAPMMIEFREMDTRLILFLKEKSANQLNALLGFMPNNLQTGKLLLTADAQLALVNLLSKGEQLFASFQNLQPKSPRLKVDAVLPYVFQSPFGLEAHFDMFRYQLAFRKVALQTGVSYQLSTAESARLLYHLQSSRVIEIDSAGIIATRSLTNNIDTRSQGLGIDFQSNHTDYRYNPHRGWYLKVQAAALGRKVLPSDAVKGLSDGSGFAFSSLYDTIQLKSSQYQIVAEFAWYLPLANSLTLKIGYNGSIIHAPQLFQNDLQQIGGFRMLRGFDEQSIFANQYQMTVLELRLKLAQNSFCYLFSDNAWVQTRYNRYFREGMYNGFGLGTSLETKSGIFSIALAFGRSDFLPLRFRESKLSFGYTALF
jgi:outer membrane protein assembly factor BamA